ncbi:MAG TPA: carboxypeptidase regulatory-like domain-containing protein, partial [Thermoanaerobaculia bacterium]|nr:carboxypeptidase regulatory-like domain-containing protein [Thermoanaerobaculia bacterium]
FVSETKAGADGSFAMADAPEGSRAISARAAGFIPLTRFALEQRSDERIVMRRGGIVRGTVTDAAGKPAEGAIVICDDVAARADASGVYRLEGVAYGTRAVETIYKEDFAARNEAVKVLREAEAETPLRLAKAAAVAGSVIEESTRKPIAGVRISLLNPGRLFGGRRAARLGHTDARGRFRVGGLGAHHYTVSASRDGYLPATIPNVAAALASPGSVAIALQRAATMAGVVSDDKGQPAGGARVRIQRDPNMRALLRGASVQSVFGQLTAMTGPDGAFLLRGLPAFKGAIIEATKSGFASARKLGMSWKTGEQVKGVTLALKRGLTASGKVVDGQNLAVAGAQIYAQKRDLGPGGGRGGFAMRVGTGQADKADAVSGADGTFTVGGLEEGDYAVSVTRDGYARKAVTSLEVKGPDVSKWPPIVLSAGMAVAGSVKGAQGQPVIGAQIFAVGESAGRPLDASTDGDGRFRIAGLAADRPLRLMISADGFASAQRNVTPPAEDLSIVLKSTGTVRGRVEDAATKNPITDFTIGRMAGPGGFGGGMQIQIRNGQVGNGDRTFQSADGTFELTDVPPGKWTIRASASSYRNADVSGVEVVEGETKEGVVLSLKKGGSLAGRVLDPQKGTGVPNASVTWRAQGGGGMGGFGGMMVLGGGGNNATATDADGRFSFDGLPDGKVTVNASHSDYLEASRDVNPDDQPSVDITLGTGGSISGTVVGRDQRTPLGGAQVSLNEEGDSTAFANDSAKTDGNGNFSFDHLRAARYRLTAQSSAGNTQPREVVLGENQAQSGVLLTMIAGALVQGTVSGLPAGRVGGVRIFASAQDYNDNAMTDDNGKFTLKDVPSPSVVRLNASTSFMQGRSTSMTLEVPAGATEVPVEIVFAGVSRLAGRVTRGGKPLGGLFVSAVPEQAGGQGQRFSGQTDENGSYSLDGMTDGTYQVSVNGQGANYRKAFAVSGDTSGDVVLPGVTISGSVIDTTTSQPIEGASVQAEVGNETQVPSIKRTLTDSNGSYSIDDVDPGNYQVSAKKSGYQMKTQTLSVSSDTAQLDFTLQPGAGVQIRVVDGQTGLPLKAINALAFAANGTVASQGPVSLDATGTGEIPSLTQGRYSIYVFSDGYAPRSFAAVDVPAPLVTIVMTPGGRVDVRTAVAFSGRIVDASGAPYLLGAFSLTGRVSPSPPITSWQHVAPGSYNLMVQTSGAEKAYPFTVLEGQITTVVVQ